MSQDKSILNSIIVHCIAAVLFSNNYIENRIEMKKKKNVFLLFYF